MIARPIGRLLAPLLSGPVSSSPGLPWESGGGGVITVAPANTVAPVISSDGAVIGVGETLTTTNGTWTGTPSPTFTYQWQRSTTVAGSTYANIALATASTYLVTSADVGFNLRCVVTGTNVAGNASANSNALIYLHATDLATAAIGVSTSGVTQATGTVSAWAASLGGLSLTLTAPAATNEPAYNATGGEGSRPLITFDGNDNVLRLLAWNSGVTWADYEIGIVGHRVATSADGDIFIGYYTGGILRYSLQDLDASTFKWVVVGGATSVSTTDPDTTSRHLSGTSAANSQSLLVNGTAEDTDAATTTSRADGGSAVLGAGSTGATASNIAVQAWYFSRALTAGKRTNLRALLTNYTGVAS